MPRGPLAAAAVATLLLTLAGCGGSDTASSAGPSTSAAATRGSSSSASASAGASAGEPAGSSAPSTTAGPGWTSPAQPTLGKAFELPRQPNAVFAVAVSHDGTLLATGDGDGTVKLWHADGSAVATLKGHRDQVTDLAFSPDGTTLASVSSDGTLRLWDVASGNAKVVTISGPKPADELRSVTWSPDGSSVVTTGWGASGVHVVAADGTPQTTLALDPSLTSVSSAAFSPDGATLVIGDIDRGVLEFWQTSDWAMRSQADEDYSGGTLTYASDGSRVYGIGNSQDVDAWDATTGAPMQKLDHGDDADQLALSPDGTLVASAYGIFDGTLHLSSVADGSLLAHDKQDALPTDLVFSPTEPLLVASFGPEVVGYRIG